ncbi:MAG: twin-arginine translocation signal domain-containing protein [Campylobacter sp.]|nr:twin-arginine translocation signal domain-containing protein [Campylobacter sp.]
MVLQNRRKFLQKALGVGAIAVASAATAAKLNVNHKAKAKSKKCFITKRLCGNNIIKSLIRSK